jgi:hypothetical protein
MIVDEVRHQASNASGAARKGAGKMADGARAATRKAHDAANDGMIGVMDVLPAARAQAEQLADRVPEVMDRAREGAWETKKTLDAMDEATLKELAAGSLGLAGGLYVAGAPRLIVVAAATPGILALGAWATRRPAH